MRHVLIANPGTKRCEAFRRALADGWPDADLAVVPWVDVVRAGGCLDGLPAFDRPAVVRLESPGKDAVVTRLLIAAGGGEAPDLPRGVLYQPGRWYAGFCRVLEGLKQSFAARPHLAPTACPLAVAAMFDKNRTLATLAAAGVPVPDWIDPDGLSPDLLFDQLRERRWNPGYVKLNTGASAVGIVVLRFADDGTPSGVTTLARQGGQFFNTRRLRTVTRAALRECVAFLLAEGATVQRGVPHAQLDGQNADLRVVCLRGRPVATVFRLSPHPVTNLHLGGRRGDWAACRRAIPTRAWLDALDACAAAAASFESAVAGVDVVFEPGFARHAVLEVNAFGDFFPGWADAAGRSLHHLQIAAGG